MAALSTAIALGATAYGTYSQSNAQREQGEYQRRQYEQNATYAEGQAQDAIARGEEEASSYGKQVRQVRGSQRIALARQGIDPNSGSAADVQLDTEDTGARDIRNIKNNAWREAWGFRTQGENYRSQGQMAERIGQSSANSTLLTGGLNAINIGLNTGRTKK